jgi:hypothetical protein
MNNAKLIFKANETYLPTPYSASYYGSVNGIVYIVYSAPYVTPAGKSGTEFFIAKHEEFSYNPYEDRIIQLSTSSTPMFNSLIDKPDLKSTVLKSFKNCKSYEDAEGLLDKFISDMISKTVAPKSKENLRIPEE